MSSRSSLAPLAAACAFLVSACSPAPAAPTVSAEGRFTVVAAGALTESVDGTGWHTSAWDDDDRGYVVKWSELPARGLPPQMVKEIYDKARDESARAIGGTVRADRDRDVAGHPGRELVVAGAVADVPATMHARMVIVGVRFYVLLAIAPVDAPEEPARAFLDSFAASEPPADSARAAGGVPAGFTRQAIAADGFAVDAPGVPQHQGTIYVWNWTAGLGLVAVAFADADAPVAAEAAAKVIDEARDAELEPDHGGKVVAERPVELPGATAARDVEWTRPDPDGTWHGLSRVAVVGARTWVVTVQSLSTMPDDAGMRAVVASFELTKHP